MPHKFKKPCAYPGCPNLTDEEFCPLHKKSMGNDYNRYQRFDGYGKRYGSRWTKIRNRYMKAHPLCEQCLKEGRMVPAQECHHILPVSRGGTDDESNLMALCKSCHNKIHIALGDRHPHE